MFIAYLQAKSKHSEYPLMCGLLCLNSYARFSQI